MEPSATDLLGRLKAEIRRLEALPPSSTVTVLPSGFEAFDSLLPGGGLPSGRVVELCGEPASGKTTLCLMTLAAATRRGELVAYVDPSRELYPPAVQAFGADLSRLLLVRPKDPTQALRAAALLARSGAFAAVVVDLASAATRSLPQGPLGRRLLEAAELGRAAVVVLSGGPSGLDCSMRVAVTRLSEHELGLTVDRSRLGAPGRTARGLLPDCDRPRPVAAEPLKKACPEPVEGAPPLRLRVVEGEG